MTKTLNRALVAATFAGIATLGAAIPASADPAPTGSLLDVVAQNLSNNVGNQQAIASHTQGVQNNAQQNNSDQSEVSILRTLPLLNELTAVI